MRNAAVVLALAVTLGIGCKKEAVRFDEARVESEVERRMTAAFERPAVDAAIDQFFEAVISDPAVGQAGEQTATALLEDPAVSGALASLTERISQSGEVQRVVAELMAANPGASPDDIGNLTSERIGRAWETPAVDQAFDASWNAFVAKVDAPAELDSLQAALTRRLQSAASVSAEREAKWSARITELAGGRTPAPDQATELYLDTAWAPERVEAFLVTVLANPKVRALSAAALRDIASQAQLVAELRKSAGRVVSDEDVQAKVVAAMLVLFASQPDRAAVEAAFSAVLTHPLLVEEASRLLRFALGNPEIAAIGSRWVEGVMAEPSVQTEASRFFDEW